MRILTTAGAQSRSACFLLGIDGSPYAGRINHPPQPLLPASSPSLTLIAPLVELPLPDLSSPFARSLHKLLVLISFAVTALILSTALFEPSKYFFLIASSTFALVLSPCPPRSCLLGAELARQVLHLLGMLVMPRSMRR
eukprot:747153-Hanusia_phi.AAC.4